ncbi:hypothetical protein K8353_45955, partial [Burkholderia contaminans]|nr:hypothetical protein [Burkholderia contaminans]
YTIWKENKKLAVEFLLVLCDLDYHLDKFKEPIQYLKHYLVKQQLDCKRDDHPKEFHNPNNRFDKNNGKKSPEKFHFFVPIFNSPKSIKSVNSARRACKSASTT